MVASSASEPSQASPWIAVAILLGRSPGGGIAMTPEVT
jgi:hypothetical protein